MTHTPTPWKMFTTEIGTYIGVGEETGEGILDVGFGVWRSPDEAKENAAFIVKACNLHEELVDALKRIHNRSLPFFDDDDKERRRQLSHVKSIAEIALAKAGAL